MPTSPGAMRLVFAVILRAVALYVRRPTSNCAASDMALSENRHHRIEKSSAIVTSTSTGTPASRPGLNRHC